MTNSTIFTDRRTVIQAAWLNDVDVHVFGVQHYGAIGDGVTNDLAAINAAVTAANAAGGGTVYLPAGTYKVAGSILPLSNVILQGAGMGVTKIVCTGSPSPNNIAIYGTGALGSNYAINTPTEGALTVTTSTASHAGNFSVGEAIGVSGDFYGQDWIPFYITTVATADAGTGVITLTEKLRRTDLSKVHKVTAQLSNMGLRDLTITSAGDIGLLWKYVRNCHVRNVYFDSGITTAGANLVGSREIVVDGCVALKNIGFHSIMDATVSNCTFRNVSTPCEGGCESVAFIGNHTYDPPGYGYKFDTQADRCSVIGCSVLNVPNLYYGIVADGAAVVASGGSGDFGDHVFVGNTLTGGAVGDFGVSIASNTAGCMISGNRIDGFDFGVSVNGSDCSVGPNMITNCTTPYNFAAAAIKATGTSAPLHLPAGTTANASGRIPHGVAPTSPVNGDVWTTTAGLFVRINGSTVGPLS